MSFREVDLVAFLWGVFGPLSPTTSSFHPANVCATLFLTVTTWSAPFLQKSELDAFRVGLFHAACFILIYMFAKFKYRSADGSWPCKLPLWVGLGWICTRLYSWLLTLSMFPSSQSFVCFKDLPNFPRRLS